MGYRITTIKIEDDLRARINAEAARSHRCLQAIITDAVERYLSRIENEEIHHEKNVATAHPLV